jgi:hypothetical protein
MVDPPAMPRWIILAALLASCSYEMSDREYCTRRQTGWEMAFPNLPLGDADRTQFVDSCVANVARAHDNGELARSIACMNKHLVGHGHANEQYLAFTQCEKIDPTRER